MANNFATKTLRLSNQLVTVTGNLLYVNGVPDGTGSYDPIGVAAASGQAAWTAANTNAINLSGNLTTTGSALTVKINSMSGWVAQQTMAVPFVAGGGVIWTNMANTGAFFNGSSTYVTKLDLVAFTGVRLVVNMGQTAGTASGALYLGYVSPPFVATPASYLSLDTNVTRTRIGLTTTVIDSGWNPIAAGARSGVYVALLGSSGSAAVSPVFGMVTAQFM